jgi:PRTRC genetic system ThiF family protein
MLEELRRRSGGSEVSTKTARKTTGKATAPVSLDLSYMNAATILPREFEQLDVLLVGCGGTGSYMALHIARMMRVLTDAGKDVRATFIDPDKVEEKNIGRQNFCDAEVGKAKALTLASRYGAAWGLDIGTMVARFDESIIANRWSGRDRDRLTVIVGCVDNAAGRKSMAAALKRNHPAEAPDVWWLDCGNHSDAGQVLLGSTAQLKHCAGAFETKTLCLHLPSPALQRPELLDTKPEELTNNKLSCAELQLANLQSLNINARIAAEAADMLTRLLVTKNLKRFACEIDLAAGSMRSTYATPENVDRSINRK